MGQAGETGNVAGGKIGQRLFEGHHEIFHRACHAGNESGGDGVRAGGYFDRNGANVIIHLHMGIDGKQRCPLAVDGDLDLFARLTRAKHGPDAGVIESHLKDVLAIGRKNVSDNGAAAGAKRRAVDMLDLRERLRNVIGLDDGTHARISDRGAADLARGPHVAFHQRGRNSQNVGDIVEPLTAIVRGQQRIYIDLKAQQVANRIGVLGAIEPVQGWPSRIGVRHGKLIQFGFQRSCKGGQNGGLWPGSSRRRHHAGTDFLYHLFSLFNALVQMGEVDCGEREAAGFQALIMAAGAVLFGQVGHGGSRHVGRLGARGQCQNQARRY